MADKKLDQARYRRTQIAVDQWGRRWAQIIEISTGDPCCGNGHPFQWDDPLQTPHVYISIPRGDHGLPEAGKVKILCDEWIGELEESFEDWRKFLFAVGKHKYKKTTPEEVSKWDSDPYLLEDAGPKPGAHLMRFAQQGETSPIQVLRRAFAGDPVLLGKKPLPPEFRPKSSEDEEFEAFEREYQAAMGNAPEQQATPGVIEPVELDWPAFVKMRSTEDHRRSLTEIAEEWRIYKATLEAEKVGV
jgi:hypothetical protein